MHEDDKLIFEAFLESAIKQKTTDSATVDARFPQTDGSNLWLEMRSESYRDDNGAVITIHGTAQDITARKTTEKNLATTRTLLEESQQIAKVGGWELDIKTSNLYWTAETYHLHDTTPEEFNPTVDAGVGYFLPDSKAKITAALDEAINNGKNYDLELETYTTKGREITVRTTGSVTKENGKAVKITGIFQDITQQKRDEKALARSLKMEVVGQMSGGIAHDFNNLLSIIIGNVELLESEIPKTCLLYTSPSPRDS